MITDARDVAAVIRCLATSLASVEIRHVIITTYELDQDSDVDTNGMFVLDLSNISCSLILP